MQPQLSEKSTPELPKSENWGGKVRIYRTITASGSLQGFLFSGLVLLAGIATMTGQPAFAQDAPAACGPAIARVVSLQGSVELQRAGTAAWIKVNRLDTTLCAGDRLRTDSLSRAALFVQPETIVRVDQNTAISVGQTADEILIEFHPDVIAQAARDAQSCGAGYFITRFPRKFKVATPHMNAAVEGTEFAVESSCKATRLTVLEGQVLSQIVSTQESQSLTAGQRLVAGPDVATDFSTVVRPTDAVQWVLHFPPLTDAATPAGASTTDQAERLLRLGSVDEAHEHVSTVLAANAHDANALALRSIIEISRNDKPAALATATAATAADPGNYRGWLAMSYAQQASFELDAALASARRAGELEPGSSLINARVAELLMSLGRVREAEAAARAALAGNPRESRAHSVLGFVHLAQVRTAEARAAFDAAIERDSFAPLPRLGLGLALIREGQLLPGREQIEIAVALDPGNSLLRSYVGKAYYEEKTRERGELAASQFRLAEALDTADPTPWLYDALNLQTTNRPVEALHAIRRSVELNDNRAVFRSRFKLDEDLAVRSASQGRIYRDLGFEELAVLDGSRSVSTDPGDFSGHRLLADTYSGIPRTEIARVNELYTSQLLQPLNLTPIPPQLGEANLFILDTAGPTDIAFNEFNPLFARDRWAVHASATAGGNDTWGNDLTLAVMQGRWSFSVGQFHFETEGFRANNDLDQDVYNGFAQFRQSERTSWITELRVTRREQGDLQLLFDPENFNANERQHEDTESARIGVHHVFGDRSEMLATVSYQTAEFSVSDLPAFHLDGEVESYIGEIQHIYSAERWRLVSGLRQTHRERFESSVLLLPVPFPPFVIEDIQATDLNLDSTSAYAYAYLNPVDSLRIDVGASADFLETSSVDREQVNPKLGLTWELRNGTSLRLAAVRSVQPDSFSRQDIPPRLEPTQVAGFNQAFFGDEGEREWRYGFAIDHEVSRNLYFGLELVNREVDIPIVFRGAPDEPEVVEEFDATEYTASAYMHWTPSLALAVSLGYRFDERENESFARAIDGIDELRTNRAPLSVRYFHPSGLSAEATATYVDQEGWFFEFLPVDPFEQVIPGSDEFWVLDAAIRYRLPRRMGIVSLNADNILDEEFRFQDIDPANPDIIPERLVSLKLTIAF